MDGVGKLDAFCGESADLFGGCAGEPRVGFAFLGQDPPPGGAVLAAGSRAFLGGVGGDVAEDAGHEGATGLGLVCEGELLPELGGGAGLAGRDGTDGGIDEARAGDEEGAAGGEGRGALGDIDDLGEVLGVVEFLAPGFALVTHA